MTYGETENIEAVEAILKEAGFTVSQRCCSRPSCFDFAARKSRTLVFVKVQSDTEKVSPSDYLELKVISEHVSATGLLISEKSREKSLEDDTVYFRYDVFAVTQATFESMMLRNVYPLVQAGPGGYYVEIDGRAINKRRLELDLSIGKLAEMMGISRRTLYGYERGMAKASVSIAYNLINVLGIPVAKPIDVFQESKNPPKHFLNTAKQAITRNKVLQKLFRKLACHSITHVEKAPFDFLISFPKEKMKIIGGVASNRELELNRRVREILSVSRIVQAHPILITERHEPSSEDILCIPSKELSRIEDPEDLITNFKQV